MKIWIDAHPGLSELTPLTYDGDGVFERADGDLELGGFVFALDPDRLDPPSGLPDAEEISDEDAMRELCLSLELPEGSL